MRPKKIQIPKIDKYLSEINDEVQDAKDWLAKADLSLNYDEGEYLLKQRFIHLWDIILTKLDDWEKNFWVYDYKSELSNEEKADTINLNINSYRVYQTRLRNKIKSFYQL